MWNAFISVMVNILLFIYQFVGENFGIAIILFTILIRLVLYPLNASQIKSTQKMQDMQKSKKWQDIQKKYKDDKEKLAQEQMKLYQEMGVNPFGSCLPTLLQFPIIIGLYQAIIRTLAVSPLQLVNLSKHITGMADLIPIHSQFLWMDLSEPERVFVFGIGVPTLAIIVVITTFLQSRLMTPPTTGQNDQGAQMTKAMSMYMPIFMGWLAYQFSSGLALYFVVSNIATIVQYAAMGRLDWNNVIPERFKSSS